MLFDTTHILYMVISAIVTAAILVASVFIFKTQKSKDNFLKFWAVITVVIHFSSIYTDYFFEKIENPELGLSMFIPAYPCNVCMWLLLIVAFANKNNKVIKLLSQFVALGGIVCAIIGIAANENYAAAAAVGNPLANYEVVKGLVSHSTMLVGSLYLLVGKYVKPSVVGSTLGVGSGLLILCIDGFIINSLNSIFGMPSVNSMYLQEPLAASMPWFNTFTMGLAGLSVAFLIGVIVEFISLPKEERWYSKLKRKSKTDEIVNSEESKEIIEK